MTNREAINLLEEVRVLDDSIYAYNKAYSDALEMALTALEAEEAWYDTHEYPPKERWIPVSSGKLPKTNDWVNVTVLDESGDGKFSYKTVGWYLSDGMWIVDNEPMHEDNLIRVVAWCELPEPWKGESK